MRHRPVEHAFDQIQALLPVVEDHLTDLRGLLWDCGHRTAQVNLLVQAGWHPASGVSVTTNLSGAELPSLASSHQKLALAAARDRMDTWADVLSERVAHLLSTVVANDASKPSLSLGLLARCGDGPTTFHLKLETVADMGMAGHADRDRIGTPNAAVVLRGLRLAAMAKGIGQGPQWLLSLDGNSGFLRVQAPTMRHALAWIVGTRVVNLPERVGMGMRVDMTRLHPEATGLLQRWARITPQPAPAPLAETILGF